MKARIENESPFPLVEVRRITWGVLEWCSLNLGWVTVRVCVTDHWTHWGNFYKNEHGALITAHVPERPHFAHDRRLRGGPPPIDPKNWQESLGCIVAHEGTHLTQYLNRIEQDGTYRAPARAHERRLASGRVIWVSAQTAPVYVKPVTFREVKAEWAEHRFLALWRTPWKEEVMAREEYAVVVDDSMDAVLLRDVLLRVADRYEKDADRSLEKASMGYGTGKTRALDNASWKQANARTLREYAKRFEHIRLQEVDHIKEALGMD